MRDKDNIPMNSNGSISTSKVIPSILLLLYLFVDLLRLFEFIPLVVGNSLYVLVGLLSILYSMVKNGLRKQIPIFAFILFYLCFGFLSLIINKNMDIQELLWPFAFAGMALLLLNFTIPHKVAKFIYYLVSIFIFTRIAASGGVNNLDIVGSRNTISVMVLAYFSIYAISCANNKRKININAILLGLIVTFMAIGRSGILTFAIVTALFLLFKYDGKEYRISNPIKIIVVMVIGSILLWISYYFLESYYAQAIANFQNRGLESIRFFIWQDYIEKSFSSLKHLFFGAPISGTFLLNSFNYNLHNSFLMLHAKYGVVVLTTVIILVLKAFAYFIKSRNVIYFILLLAVMFRMQFDYTNFNAQLDIILFYLLFYPFIRRCSSDTIRS